MSRSLMCVGIVALALGCQRKLDGPQPQLSGVDPQAVCVEQLTTKVTLSGEGLAPLVVDSLTAAPKLELPRVSLTPAKALDGTASSGDAVAIPDDSAAPEQSHVQWTSQRQMTFEVFPELQLAPGLYGVHVENRNGKTADLAGALLAVPRPSISEVVPDLACRDRENTVEVRGDFFIAVGAVQPSVTVGTLKLTPTAMADCRALPGALALQACRRLTVVVPTKTLAAGTLSVVVENPAPIGCRSSDAATLTLVPEPTVTKIEPDLVCDEQGPSALKLTGTGFLTVDGATPTLTLVAGAQTLQLATLASDCVTVTGPKEATQSCTTLTATLPQASLPAGSYLATVTNPAPADCTSPQGVGLVVAPAPVVTSVVPDIACAAGGAVQVVLGGTGFLTVDGVSPGVAVGAVTLSATASNCTPVTGALERVTTCTTLTFSVPMGSAVGAQSVVVTNPPPAGCASSSRPLVLFDKPVVTDVSPGATCTMGLPATLTLTGTGFVKVDAASPRVSVGATSYPSTASNCTPVMGPTETVSVCTRLTVAGVMGLPIGSYPVTVTNPMPVGCASSASAAATFAVTATPTLTGVTPPSVCKGKATLTLTGTNLVTNMTATVGSAPPVDADTVTANGAGTSALATFPPTLPLGGPYSVTVGSGGCSATLPAQVTVISGPQLFFVDPNVVYNGVAIQATVYGGAITGSIQSVTLTPSAGGAAQALVITPVPGQTNQVQVKLPQGLAAGDYDVEVSDLTACTGRLPNAIHVTGSTTLGLASIVPAFGWQGSSTAVTVKATTAAAGFSLLPRAYLNPSSGAMGAVATALGAVSFLDARTLTATVPSGLPVDTYDLIVVNPDQRVGLLPAAFRVVSAAPPTITGLSPGSVANTNPQTFGIVGRDFRMPQVTLSCVDGAGAPLAISPAATVTASTATSVTASFNASVAGAACVVRVTDTDNQTFADFSALVITNPAQNLYAATFGPDLLGPRRAPVVLGGDATSAARFLHVIGGDDGGTALGTVESSSLSLLGVPAGFAAQRYGLVTPRTQAGGARVGQFLYVAGGSSTGGALATIERATVLDPARRQTISGVVLDVLEGSGLGAGVWFYRVSTVMGPADPFNPNGENLASDPFPLQLPALTGAGVRVRLQWAAEANAAKYRVYRSATPGAVPEQLIAEVSAPSTSYTDTGGAPVQAVSPLPIGSTGAWSTVATLPTPREGPGVAWGKDPADATKAYLYVLGGRQSATTVSRSYDILPLTLNADGSQTAGAPVAGTAQLSAARWMLSSSSATHDSSPRVPAGKTFVYALSGFAANGAALVNAAEGSEVLAGGQLKAFTALPILLRAGYANVVAGNFVFAFGGNNGAPDTSIVGGEICSPSVAGCGPMGAPPEVGNWNAGQTMLAPRLSAGGALHGAFIYLAGGASTAMPLTLTAKTEYRLW